MKLETSIGWLVVALAIIWQCLLLAWLYKEYVLVYGGAVNDLRLILVPLIALVSLVPCGSALMVGVQLLYPGRWMREDTISILGRSSVVVGLCLFIGFEPWMFHTSIFEHPEDILISWPFGITVASGWWLMSGKRNALFAALFFTGLTAAFFGTFLATLWTGLWAAASYLAAMPGGLIVLTTLVLLLRDRHRVHIEKPLEGGPEPKENGFTIYRG